MTSSEKKAGVARLIAFYLPQYHPIPENDEWWGKGFTEWTNVARARPLFPGHYQPRIPADLGFYDLRVSEVREAQAELAQSYGLEGFCYYHYWFGGRKLLHRPFDEVLASGQPDFPFCLCWANETWTGVWHGSPGRVLIEQTYPGEQDHRQHFRALLPAFRDHRYIRVDGKPLFVIYSPNNIPDPERTILLWQNMARDAGLPGVYFAGVTWNVDWDPGKHGFDAAIVQRLAPRRPWYHVNHGIKIASRLVGRLLKWPSIFRYSSAIHYLLPSRLPGDNYFPCVVPNWDNTPRSGSRGLVLHGASPESFREHFRQALKLTENVPPEKRVVFVKSWNEWAEGNYLEPDQVHGHGYLRVIRDELTSAGKGVRTQQ